MIQKRRAPTWCCEKRIYKTACSAKAWMMSDDRHLSMLPMECKASAKIKCRLYPSAHQCFGKRSLARQMMRFIDTIKEQINSAASVK